MDIKIKSSKKPQLKYLWVGVFVALLGVTVVKAKQHLGEATAFVDVEELRISQVQRGHFEVNVRGIGSLKPQNTVWLSSQVAGRVETIYKKAGAMVESGDAIVKLSNPQLLQSAASAESALIQLKAQNKAAQAQLQSQLLDGESQLSRAKIDYDGVKRELDAQQKLREMGNSTVSDLEFERSRFNVKSAKLHWQHQQKKLANLKVHVEAQLLANQTKEQQLANDLKRARQQVASLIVRAAGPGMLQTMVLELGQNVPMGGSVGKIADPRQLLAQIDIQQLQIKDVAVGQQVTIDTRKSQINGVVSRIDPQVLKGLVSVEVELQGTLPNEARPELSVEGIIQISDKQDVLFVNKPYYAQEYKTAKIYRINANGHLADAIEVDFGKSSVNHIEIRQGLQAGDRIIISKTDAFAQNQQVFLHNYE